MGIMKGTDIRPAKGKLGVLLPGMGAVSTTFMAGVEAVRRGHAKPIGSLTQMGTIRLGKRTENRSPAVKEFVPLAGLDDLVFGGWDIFAENAYDSAKHAGVLTDEDLARVRPFLESIQPLAKQKQMPICGKDFKTGQTLMKTILAPGFKARYLGLEGWYSTNILGNRDGEVLEDPDSFKSKEVSKLGVLEHILQPHLYPDLYKDFAHVVRINYYPPRGDNKEGWDNIDIFGWLGYPMQIKVNFLCRDSILAAPIVLDLALFSDFAQRAGMKGIQEWLSFYYKSPMAAPGLQPEHDLFIQQTKLKNTLRHLMGEEQITHLGLEYYQS